MIESNALPDILDLVQEELADAMEKFPPMNSMHEGWAVVWEELDEAWEEVRKCRLPQASAEMLQVAAMALRFIYDLNQEVGS